MILLDTHVGLWLAASPSRLGARTTTLLESPGGPVRFSALLVIETTIKQMRGALPDDIRKLPAALIENGLGSLPITAEHAAGLRTFPELAGHDPFDRLYLAQAWVERARFLTADRRLLALGYDWILDARA